MASLTINNILYNKEPEPEDSDDFSVFSDSLELIPGLTFQN